MNNSAGHRKPIDLRGLVFNRQVNERLVAGIKRFQPVLSAAKSRDVGEADTGTIKYDRDATGNVRGVIIDLKASAIVSPSVTGELSGDGKSSGEARKKEGEK